MEELDYRDKPVGKSPEKPWVQTPEDLMIMTWVCHCGVEFRGETFAEAAKQARNGKHNDPDCVPHPKKFGGTMQLTLKKS